MKIPTYVLLFLALIASAITGCSSIRERAETSGTNRVTTIHINTLFDAKAVVDKIKASNGATHSLGAQGVSEESSSDVITKMTRLAEVLTTGGLGGGVSQAQSPRTQVPISITQEQVDEAVRKLAIKNSQSIAATAVEVNPSKAEKSSTTNTNAPVLAVPK